MCSSGPKAPPPPPPPPMAPPVLEQEAPSLSKELDTGNNELTKRSRGTTKYKNKLARGNSGNGLGTITKKGS